MGINTARRFAWAGFALGTAVSIAANVVHATQGTWTPAEVIGAGFWPVALMLSVEILTRRDSSRDHWAKRVGLGLGLVMVAGVAAFLSYLHMRGLLESWDEGAWPAGLGPLAVDGLMLVSGLALLPDRTLQAEDETDHRLVFVHPEPIGPQPDPSTRWDRALDELAATAYAGAVAPRPIPLNGQLVQVVDRPREPSTAPLNGHTRTVKAVTTPKAAPTPRAPATPVSGGKAKALAFYNAETAAGRTPTGPQLAEVAGANRRTGARWLAEFEEENADA